ncbi:hypothetical protein [Streptomyces alkaliterrae]|uniref:Uncharacterized protein n=1 Tax=Streptomyces alkaliterrae TaxID=2213162 RepID=A0A5P0YJI7_9ACTN|nr:hypothetical protein [Streptomyces alkaliterrae]MBB1257510.1 hypothetical protein [Streptomyces alkaliterrae]MQS00398.1 hypothetical protein [Streptomyces alkaliterrae]
MSIPGEQPNPYGGPGQQAGQPQPQPHNPYAQPATGGYGYAAASQALGSPVPGPSAGPPAGASRGRLPGWVWALGGVVLASAVWAAGTIVGGGFGGDSEPTADLAGYRFHKDMCESVYRSPFLEHYTTHGSSASNHSTHDAMDTSSCLMRYKRDRSSRFASTFVTFTATWHKQTDPTAEFEARAQAQESRSNENQRYRVEPVEELGEEAFLITSERKRDGQLTYAALAVRDRWVETHLEWSDVELSRAGQSPLTKTQVRSMLTKSTEETLAELRKPTGSDASNDSDEQTGGSDSDSGPPKRGEGDI